MPQLIKTLKKDEAIKQVIKDTTTIFSDIPHTDLLLVLFDKDAIDEFSAFVQSSHQVSIYYQKQQRIYEKEISYQEVNDTIIEFFLAQDEISLLHITPTFYFKEPFFQKPYELTNHSMIGIPLKEDDQLIGILIVYTTLQEVTNLYQSIDQSRKSFVKLLKAAFVIDQVLPVELSQIKNELIKTTNGFLVSQTNQQVFLSDELKNNVLAKHHMVTVHEFESIQAQDSKKWRIAYRIINYQGREFQLGSVVFEEISVHVEQLVSNQQEAYQEIIQNHLQKIKYTVIAIMLSEASEHRYGATYEAKQVFYRDLFDLIHDFFEFDVRLKPWYQKGYLITVNHLVDQRVLGRLMDTLHTFCTNHPSNKEEVYQIAVGVIRFGKDAKVGSEPFERIDVLFDAMSNQATSQYYDEILLKEKLKIQQLIQVQLQQVKKANSLVTKPILQSITKEEIGRYITIKSDFYQYLSNPLVRCHELDMIYSKKLISLLHSVPLMNEQKRLIQLPMVALVDYNFYQYVKDTLAKQKIAYSSVWIEIDYREWLKFPYPKKIDRYIQLGCQIVISKVFEHGMLLTEGLKLPCHYWKVDTVSLNELLKDTNAKVIISSILSYLLQEKIGIIFDQASSNLSHIVIKDSSVFTIT